MKQKNMMKPLFVTFIVLGIYLMLEARDFLSLGGALFSIGYLSYWAWEIWVEKKYNEKTKNILVRR